ncbi:Gamma-glutamyl hydrolase [Larimichthys crocea]|uniref:Uncharacterized protein n=1 Tax=Larimichthys crocea TaxID=215358 RepID=A0ACD3Q8P8_LARCR|nr:Gamma-glutamyl hydrolase [Larimichthys crocea]
MGMQLLTVLVAGENLLTNTTAENIALPLNLTPEAATSKMFKSFPNDLMKALTQEPLTGNFHHYGLTVKTFQENQNLQSFFSALSTNIAENRVHFVSTIEGRRYPFYGTQWHPEVNRFQWDRKLNFPHSLSCCSVIFSAGLSFFPMKEGKVYISLIVLRKRPHH